MKKVIFFSITIYALIMFSGCEKEVTETREGTLSFQMRTWNTYETKSSENTLVYQSDPVMLNFIDVMGYKYEMKVTTDEIQEGMKDADINWITIYQSEELKRDGERDFQFKLPAGEYKGFAVLQGDDFSWIGETDGNQIVIPDSNQSGNDRVYNVFGADGLYYLNENEELMKMSNNEMLGVTFTIREEITTTLTIRVNITAIEWYDNDQSGTWSDGDTVGDMLLPDGVNTMSDFIVTY